jgi:hypothetical protein
MSQTRKEAVYEYVLKNQDNQYYKHGKRYQGITTPSLLFAEKFDSKRIAEMKIDCISLVDPPHYSKWKAVKVLKTYEEAE